MTRIAVVGGGIAGLSAALEIASAESEVVVLERSERFGGKLATASFRGVPVDRGPDAFLSRVPEATELATRIGLAGDLIAPAATRALIWAKGRLRPLPTDVVLGFPAGQRAILASGLLSPLGAARAGMDLLLPRSRLGEDPSVAEVVRARFGQEVLDELVEPLLGAVHACRADDLSLASVAPEVLAATSSRSLLMGLASLRRERARAAAAAPGAGPASGSRPAFHGLRSGMESLVTALVGHLTSGGAELCAGEPVVSVTTEHARAVVRTARRELVCDAVVLAVPAPAAAGLLGGSHEQVATELSRITYASVVVAALAYEERSWPGPAGDVAGFLVPVNEGRLMTAATFTSSKWPHLAPQGEVLVRVSAGRLGDARARRLEDHALVAALDRELKLALGGAAGRGPVASLVTRWDNALPQASPGHIRLLARIAQLLADHPVRLAGAAYGGTGVPGCIRSGQGAARELLAVIGAAEPPVAGAAEPPVAGSALAPGEP
ncbi:MAG: protoporphyrinogen oxidase [Acidimicrobiales bacterium]